MSILFDHVRISAFGGLRAPLQLDLTAPLTVIYAPNGTGKTSVVESVDWILGGDVREERCRIAEGEETTEVMLSGMVGDSPLSVRKSLRADGRAVRIVNGVSVGEADFLQALAPDCDVAELNALTRIPRLKAFLSSNRVLGIGSLSRLIDADNADARADAMADLTGTRAQRNARKVIDNYRKKLREKLGRLSDELQSLNSRQEDYLEFAAERGDANALVQEASRIVSYREPGVRLSLEELVVRANAENEEVVSRLAASERLRELLNAPLEFSDLGSVAERIKSLEDEVRAQNVEINDNLERYHSLTAEAKQLERDADGLHILSSALVELQATVGGDAVFREIYAEAKQFESIPLDHDSGFELLSLLSSASARFPANLNRREEISRDLESLQVWLASAESIEQLSSNLASKIQDLARVRASRESLRTLQNEAVRASLLVHQRCEDVASCPACGHDWGSVEALAKALNSTLSSLPESEGALLSRETQLIADIDLLKDGVSKIKKYLEHQRVLCDELKVVESEIEKSEQLAARFGFDSVQLIDDEVLARLKHGLKVAGALRRFEVCRKGSHITFHPRLDSPPARQADGLRESAEEFRSVAADRRGSAEDISLALTVGESRVSVLAIQVSKLREQLAESEKWRQSVRRLQDSLGLVSASAAHLDEIDSSLRERLTQIQAAQRHLNTASELQMRAPAAHKAELAAKKAAEVREDIESVEMEICRIESIDKTIESQSEEYRRRLVDSVGPSVSQLFQRMQVNRVFRSVDVSPSLELNALLKDHVVGPEMFSSGQRQDLALAFFLVRAYALGGSFLLDEPLAHLDDLNRVAVLDTLRALVISGKRQGGHETRIVLTTASWTTTKHIMQKFMRINDAKPLLRVYQLRGNVNSSVTQAEIFPSQG